MGTLFAVHVTVNDTSAVSANSRYPHPSPLSVCRACGHDGHHARGLCARCYGAARILFATGTPWVIAVKRVRVRFAPPLAADGLPQDLPATPANEPRRVVTFALVTDKVLA